MPIVDTQDTTGTLGGGGSDQTQQVAEQGLPAPVPRENRYFPTLPSDDIRNVFGTSVMGSGIFGDLINSAGYLSQMSGVDHTPDPSFDVLKTMQSYPGYEAYPQLGEARNDQEFQVIKQKIDQENADKATMANAGTLQSIAAGAFNPIYYVPFFGEARAATAGGRIAAGALHGATNMAAASTVEAGVNYLTNITVTPSQELYSIAGNTVMGSVMGGGMKAFLEGLHAGAIKYNGMKLKTPDEVANSIAAASRDYADRVTAADAQPVAPESKPFFAQQAEPESAGAMRAPRPETTLEQEGFVPANIVPDALANALPQSVSDKLDLAKVLSFQDPTMSLMNSPEIEARRQIQLLADVPAEAQKNREGIVNDQQPVESLIKQWEGERIRTDLSVHNLYNEYRFERPTKLGDSLRLLPDALRKPAGKMTVAEFSEAVDTAMRNGDKSPIPQVQEAAQLYRKNLVDPLKVEAIRLGQLDPDVKVVGAPSYSPRHWNTPAVIANRPVLESIIARSFKRSNVNITERFDNFNAQAENAERLVKEYTQKKAAAEKQISDATPLNLDAVRKFNLQQREMQVLARNHGKLETRAKAAAERVKNLTPEQASEEFSKAIGHVKNGIPKSMKAQTLSEWLRSKGGLREDEGGSLRASGAVDRDASKIKKADRQFIEPNSKLIDNQNGMNLEDAGRAAHEAGYFPDSEDRPTINEFLDALSGDMNGNAPRYSDNDSGNLDYENYIHQLGQELDQRGIDVNKLSPGQIENMIREGSPGAPDTIAQRAKTREAEYAQRRADQALQNAKDEIKRRQMRFDKLRATKETTSAAIKSARAELDDINRVLSVNNEKADRFRSQAKDVMYLARADDQELLELAKNTVDGIIGIEPGRSAYRGVPMTRGPLKERVLHVLDSEIHDFIDHDAFRNMRRYQHSLASDLSLIKVFGRADMKDQFQKINDGYDRQRIALGEKYGVSTLKMGMDSEGKWDGGVSLNELKDIPPELQKALTALNEHQRRDTENLAGVRDRLRGTYGAPSNPYSLSMRTYKVIKQLNYMRSLGMQALTAVSHAAKIPMAHGVMRFMGDGVAAFVKNGEQFRLAANEVKLAGTALEMASNATQLALNGLDDNWSGYTKFERGMSGLSDNFRFITGMAPFIASLKQMSGVISQTRSLEMIEQLAKGGSIANDESARLAKYGIGKDMAERIFDQVDQFGTKKDDVWWANTAAWQDQEAAQIYRIALQRETDKIIVTPGQDIPLFMSRPMGSMLLQFRSFAISSVQRTLISGLQQRDAAVLNGFMCATALGMFSYWAKTPSDRLSSDPKAWVAEGIDRAGAFGWFDDMNNAVEKLTGNRVGLQSLAGEYTKKQQKFDTSQAASAILGPTYSTVFTTMLPLLNDVGGGQFDQKDLHLMRQMFPLQNWFVASKIMDAAEKGVNNLLNIPKKTKQ